MTSAALSRKALHLSYEIPTEQFICKQLPSSTNNYSEAYAADVLVDEQPEYPDIPSCTWTVVLNIPSNAQVSVSVGPKESTGFKPVKAVMVNWKVGLEGEVYDGRVQPNAWVPEAANTSLNGVITYSPGRCGGPGARNCNNGCHRYVLRPGITVFVGLTFIVEKAARGVLEILQDSHTFSDCTLICGKKKLPAHRAILAAQSPVFAAMFQNEMKEKSSGVCKITDICSDVLETLVQYAYVRAPLKADGKLHELWMAADKYDMNELRTECERAMLQAVTAENAYKYLCFAEERGLKKLRAEAAKCIFQQPL